MLLAVGLAILVVVARSRGPNATVAQARDVPASGEPAAATTHRPLPTITTTETVPLGPAPAVVDPAVPTHAAGPTCESCSAENCIAATDGCDRIKDADDRKLCEELYACFSDPANNCVNQGDPVRCWCGTNPTTCLTDKTGPGRANGPCAEKVYAGARSTDPMTIRARFVDAEFPLGSAVNLTLCRGSWCSTDCKVK